MASPKHTQAQEYLRRSQCILSADGVNKAVRRVAAGLNQALHGSGEYPLALVLMRGGLVFAGQLLPQLDFAIEVGYLDVSRYGHATHGGELVWRVAANGDLKGRMILLIDDILDEGKTLAAVRDHLLRAGAGRVLIAVFADKQIGGVKPVQADFCGVSLPDRYVFGFGMDVNGFWRNLPAVYALQEQDHGQ